MDAKAAAGRTALHDLTKATSNGYIPCTAALGALHDQRPRAQHQYGLQDISHSIYNKVLKMGYTASHKAPGCNDRCLLQ